MDIIKPSVDKKNIKNDLLSYDENFTNSNKYQKIGGLRTAGYFKSNKLNNPLISIIIATKNSENYLEKCLKSIFDQEYENFEIIIVDNNSFDKTVEIIKKYNSNIDFWISEKDNGIFDAMNKGIKEARGEIISILNSDDFFYKNALKIIANYFKEDSGLDFIFGTVLKKKVYSGFKPHLIIWKFNIYPSHSVGFFIRKKIHDKIGLYNTKYKHSNDYDFFYRLIRNTNFKGISTKRDEVIGEFNLFGFSSKIPFFDRLLTELRIRYDNNQNIIDLIFIFFGRILSKIFHNILK